MRAAILFVSLFLVSATTAAAECSCTSSNFFYTVENDEDEVRMEEYFWEYISSTESKGLCEVTIELVDEDHRLIDTVTTEEAGIEKIFYLGVWRYLPEFQKLIPKIGCGVSHTI